MVASRAGSWCAATLRASARYPLQYRSLNTLSHSFPYPEKLAFAFDIDGVLKHGEHVLPGTRNVMSLLSGADGRLPKPVPFLMITNGGGMTEADRIKALTRDLGVPVSKNQLVQSHTPLQNYVERFRDKPVLVCGGTGDAARRIAHSYGLEQAYLLQDIVAWKSSVWDRYQLSEEEESFVKVCELSPLFIRPGIFVSSPGAKALGEGRGVDFSQLPLHAIFVIHDAGLDWALATQIITELLCSDGGRMGTRRKRQFGVYDGRDLPVVLTNPDFIWGTDYPLPRFGMAAFRIGLNAVYKTATGVDIRYVQFGKPFKATYEFAEDMLRRHLVDLGEARDKPLNVYMVGDNPESDILGANTHGWNSILLKTGVYETGTPSHLPTRIADNVEEGVMWALQRELEDTR
ncbi:hypothetical protein JCM24511_07555 [Saitozyma sp. JCM 24511]|nr:hypothetical protein JCM24511_07555 [Saitozyma sp. JCM 24511]